MNLDQRNGLLMPSQTQGVWQLISPQSNVPKPLLFSVVWTESQSWHTWKRMIKVLMGVSENKQTKQNVAFTNYIWTFLEMTLGHVVTSTIYGQLPFILKITQKTSDYLEWNRWFNIHRLEKELELKFSLGSELAPSEYRNNSIYMHKLLLITYTGKIYLFYLIYLFWRTFLGLNLFLLLSWAWYRLNAPEFQGLSENNFQGLARAFGEPQGPEATSEPNVGCQAKLTKVIWKQSKEGSVLKWSCYYM